MKLVWSPDAALQAYITTVQSCQNFKEPGVPELLSAMAAGWNAKLIVESWTHGGPITTSIGLAVASLRTSGRHVCVVPDERSRSDYVKSMQSAGMVKTEVIVGEAEEVMAGLAEVDFLVVDCKRRDFVRVLRLAKLNQEGAILVRKNAQQSYLAGFRWQGVLGRGTRVVRSVYMPVGKGLDVVHIGSRGGGMSLQKSPSRWIKCVDQKSGEEHVFRG
ncbi:hypothetical protein JCGZ_14532 [Jatropha curcas]|uniref:DUF1442 domain-containing protein n=2 Tax=Jatropha curcas TaxID=180498 RepID=A0A067K923_JATCU|nr:hypothetical protein JCGZ_14531 [Jatropha curcas]KDP28761.1 hypothetical protein JCGZ_14532 [Jatropha curcas]